MAAMKEVHRLKPAKPIKFIVEYLRANNPRGKIERDSKTKEKSSKDKPKKPEKVEVEKKSKEK